MALNNGLNWWDEGEGIEAQQGEDICIIMTGSQSMLSRRNQLSIVKQFSFN